MRSWDRGFTAVEMLIVIVLIGAMMAVAIPFFRTATSKGAVRGAMDAIATLHAVARAAAIQRGQTSRLVFLPSANTALVVANRSTGGVDTVGSIENLGTRFGVTFTTSRDTVVFTPRGIGADLAGTTIVVVKGDFRDTITVSASGRLAR